MDTVFINAIEKRFGEKFAMETRDGETTAFVTRPITPEDFPLLEEFIYHAIFVPPGEELPPREIIRKPDVYMYIDDYGGKPDDNGLIALLHGKPVAAAWTRIIPGYGHTDDKTPELAISVLPEYRGHGIGTQLMTELFRLLRARGYNRTSLAVQKKNAAARFYLRLGYEIVRKTDEEYVMLRVLRP